MINIYWLALGLGGAFLVLTTFLGGDSDSDGDFDGDFDGDLDGDLGGGVDLDVEGGGLEGDIEGDIEGDGEGENSVDAGASLGMLDILFLIKSIRFWTFFIAFFGLTGVGLTYIRGDGVITLSVSIGMGLFSGYSIAHLFRYMSRSNVSSAVSESDIIGSPAKVLLPIKPDDKGKVRIILKGSIIDKIAVCDEGEYDLGEEVTIVEIFGNKVKVTGKK
ncbi:MAG: NfeD family protein [Myxococcota bacterium]